MQILHLNFYELLPGTKAMIAHEIKKYSNKTATDKNIKTLFDTPNAGIDIAIYPYMMRKKRI